MTTGLTENKPRYSAGEVLQLCTSVQAYIRGKKLDEQVMSDLHKFNDLLSWFGREYKYNSSDSSKPDIRIKSAVAVAIGETFSGDRHIDPVSKFFQTQLARLSNDKSHDVKFVTFVDHMVETLEGNIRTTAGETTPKKVSAR
jgi:hypothetical protein